jgi:lipopolysaccharide export system protein LptA
MTRETGRRWFETAAVWATVAVCMTAPALAQPAPGGPPNPMQGFSQNRDQPMHIEAAKLEVRDKEKVATFSGNVQVVQGDTTMKCKVLVVYYDGGNTPGTIKSTTPGPNGKQQIRRLEAKGDVIVTQKDQVATGENGVFDVRTNTVTLSGNVVINQGPNVTRGDRLVVDLTTGVSRIDAGASRVQMLIQQNPSKDKPSSTAPPKFGPGRLF